MKELRGLPVANALNIKIAIDIEKLHCAGIVPKLAVVRVGERADDISYERGIQKKLTAANTLVDINVLSSTVSQEELENTINKLNQDCSVHGILIFRPLPKHLSEERIKSIIVQEKDVDCMGTANIAGVFAGTRTGFAPCTPQAVIELLDYYGIELTGKKVTVVGRSLVVGKPLAMLLLDKNATVTICHTKTVDLANVCKSADILIACAGYPKLITAEFVHAKQIIIDVGTNMMNGKLCGDVDFESVADFVEAITPVPGGVGMVTTSVLLNHIVSNAKSCCLNKTF